MNYYPVARQALNLFNSLECSEISTLKLLNGRLTALEKAVKDVPVLSKYDCTMSLSLLRYLKRDVLSTVKAREDRMGLFKNAKVVRSCPKESFDRSSSRATSAGEQIVIQNRSGAESLAGGRYTEGSFSVSILEVILECQTYMNSLREVRHATSFCCSASVNKCVVFQTIVCAHQGSTHPGHDPATFSPSSSQSFQVKSELLTQVNRANPKAFISFDLFDVDCCHKKTDFGASFGEALLPISQILSGKNGADIQELQLKLNPRSAKQIPSGNARLVIALSYFRRIIS